MAKERTTTYDYLTISELTTKAISNKPDKALYEEIRNFIIVNGKKKKTEKEKIALQCIRLMAKSMKMQLEYNKLREQGKIEKMEIFEGWGESKGE